MHEGFPKDWSITIRAAQRRLIKANGGIEASADIVSISKTEMGRFHNERDTEMMPLKIVLWLESECGLHYVTEGMARLHGRKLSDPEARKDEGACLLRGSLEINSKSGEYQRNASDAFADLRVSPSEASQGIRDLQALIDSSQQQIQRYASIIAGSSGETPALKIVGDR